MSGIYLAANISIPDFIPFGNTGNARAFRSFPGLNELGLSSVVARDVSETCRSMAF